MSRRLFGAGLLTAALITLGAWPSAGLLAQKKPAAKEVAIDSANLGAAEFIGTLKVTPGSDRVFNIDSEQDRLVPLAKPAVRGNPNAGLPRAAPRPSTNRISQARNHILQAQQRGQQAQMRYVNAKNQGERNKAQTDLNKAQTDLNKAQVEYQQAVVQYMVQANAQANVMLLYAIRQAKAALPAGFRVEKTKTNIEFQASANVKVRTLVLPEEFDEKGKPKKYTKAELVELKGKDKSLPGYESSLEKLEAGQKVRVVLAPVRKKKAAEKPAAKNANKDAAKDPDKDVDKDVAEEKDDKDDKDDKKMQVRLILILEEPKAADNKGKK